MLDRWNALQYHRDVLISEMVSWLARAPSPPPQTSLARSVSLPEFWRCPVYWNALIIAFPPASLATNQDALLLHYIFLVLAAPKRVC